MRKLFITLAVLLPIASLVTLCVCLVWVMLFGRTMGVEETELVNMIAVLAASGLAASALAFLGAGASEHL